MGVNPYIICTGKNLKGWIIISDKLREDEYAIILYDYKDHKDVQLKTERILQQIQKPWCINEKNLLCQPV